MRSINKQPKKPFFIVSAYVGNDDDVDRSIKLEREFKAMNLNFKPLIGSWKGKTEISYLVTTDTVEEAYDFGRNFAELYGQEAFIIVDEERNGELIPHYGKSTNLGKLVLTDKELVGALSSWSRCPMTDKYYTFKGGA
tara:strand:+ start:7097 stop:7510 length:414 start_codon:yes stop_codon:yes gene_type:complete